MEQPPINATSKRNAAYKERDHRIRLEAARLRNLGHTEPSEQLASLIKANLAFRYRALPITEIIEVLHEEH